MIRFKCANCGFEKDVSDKYSGKRVRCPACKAANHVTAASVSDAQNHTKTELIKFRCPNCNQKIGLSTDYAGKKVRCAKCKGVMRVPPAEAEKPPENTKEALGVLRLKDEQDVDGVELRLRDLEYSSQAFESGSAATDEPAGEDDFDYYEEAVPAPSKPAVSESVIDTKRLLMIAGGACAVLVVAFIVVFMICRKPSAERVEKTPKEDSFQAQAVAQEFIELLQKKTDPERLKRLCVPDLHKYIKKRKIEELAEPVEERTLKIEDEYQHFDQASRERYFLFFYALGYEDFEVGTAQICVTQADDKLLIEGFAAEHMLGETVSLKSSRFHSIYSDIMSPEYARRKAEWRCFFAFIVIVAVITMVSQCIVFHKAQEPAWAALIPIYNLVVLAEIGGRPEWWVIVIVLGGCIPGIGSIIQLYLLFSIAVGVAEAFGRGFLFGVGLYFLPFIFYPVLAFSRD